MSAQQQQFVIDGQYTGGVDSLLYPTDLIPSTYAWGVNVVNRGGVVQTRPAKRRVTSFCGRNAQGHFWVRTMDDRNYKLIAIDGKIYWAPYPFTAWTQMAGVTFLADAPRIYFCNAEQAAYYDVSDNIVILPQPKNIVFMQDGTSTPCYWDTDDFTSGKVDLSYVTTGSPPSPLPIGTVMLWQDNRLWVVCKNLVFASDLLNPANFTENQYLAETSGFRFPRPVVQMISSPVQGILVATQSSLHSLQSFIQKREDWSLTPNFQADVNLEVGFIAPWCYAYLHGMLWFLTARGIISYDRAQTENLSTVILTMDGEMARSKYLMAPDVTFACMGVWENILMVSVPASCVENRHTWIMDGGIAEKLNNQAGGCWVGIWTGTYPVQYTSPIISGTQHCYELSYSSGFLALNEGDSPSPQPETDLPLQSLHPPLGKLHAQSDHRCRGDHPLFVRDPGVPSPDRRLLPVRVRGIHAGQYQGRGADPGLYHGPRRQLPAAVFDHLAR